MRASLTYLAVGTAVGIAGGASAQLVRSAAGADAASIQSTVDAFRADLGALNANVPGSFGAGRREINWDGVPAQFASPGLLPANFFNVNSPRGLVYSTPGNGFQVSASAGGATPVRFGNLNPAYTTEFAAFSQQRLFTPIASTISDSLFFIPGSVTPATTRGFGVVFSDVDTAGAASIELFNGLNSLGVYYAPVFAGDAGFSFLGVSFANSTITKVRITSGTAALGAGVNENLFEGIDLVAMDDFIYAEPVPAPGTLGLLAISVIPAVMRRRR